MIRDDPHVVVDAHTIVVRALPLSVKCMRVMCFHNTYSACMWSNILYIYNIYIYVAIYIYNMAWFA